jgi:glycogen(starch) synthase
MRILMLAQFYPPDIGGEERHVRNLAIALSARGHYVEVLTTALPATGAGSFVEDGILIRRVRNSAQRLPVYSDPARPHAMPFPDPEMQHAISEQIERGHYDVVHAHNWIVNSAISPTKRHAVPLVLTLHDYAHICAVKRYVHHGSACTGPGPWKCIECAADHYGKVEGPATVVANWVAARRRDSGVTIFLTVSSAVADFNRLSRGSTPFEVVPNFVPDELVEDCPPQPDGPMLFVGDLTKQKGVLVLAEAYRRLDSPPELILAGRPAPGVEVPSIPGIRLVGPLPHDDVMPLVAKARMMVVPSIMPDPCPTVVLEAMAKGRPVVASANGGITDMVIDGLTGRLVTPEDPIALADGITSVLNGDAAAMGVEAHRHLRSFLASSVAERIEGIYERARRLVPSNAP